MDIDKKIADVRLCGRLLIQQFSNIFRMSAAILNEKDVDDSTLNTDVKTYNKMIHQLFNDIQNSNLSKNEKNHRVESVLSFSIKYLRDAESLLNLAKERNFDRDIRWKKPFEDLNLYIEDLKNTISNLEDYLQTHE